MGLAILDVLGLLAALGLAGKGINDGFDAIDRGCLGDDLADCFFLRRREGLAVAGLGYDTAGAARSLGELLGKLVGDLRGGGAGNRHGV